MNQNSLQCQALRTLEWDTFLESLASQAQSLIGAESCRRLQLEVLLDAATARQQETTEMRTILEGSIPFPILAFEDLQDILNRTAKGAQLEGIELYHISGMLELCRDILSSMEDHQEASPSISEIVQALEPLVWIREAIVQCVDHEGHIRESATPELHQLLQQLNQLRQRIRQRLERLLSSHDYEDVLQGQYFAEREQRYVIPVKAEMQHHIPGIVHDISGSGATVFLEPRDLIELNNAIKVADLQVKQEIRRILQDLSSMVASHVASMTNNLHLLGRLDCIGAKARLSMKMDANPVVLNTRQHISLQQARHPLLVLTKEHVIPNDIHLDETTKIYIISGPNTGGKTVTLKLLGLFALMVRTGLHLPCLGTSQMAIFEQVYADIGDAQDLHRDLSSFSAHISNMITLLKETEQSASEYSNSSSLVLLDEIGNATDPIEGAAIAEALLCRLDELGCNVVVTTHYHSLKTLPLRKPHFVNASHEFDLKTLKPTYRLLEGLPGGSSAIQIAGQLGLDPPILTHATELVQGQERDLEGVFQRLQETQQELDEKLRETTTLRLEADRYHQEARDTKDRLRKTERQERQKIRRDLQAELIRAKRMIHETIEDLKKDKSLIKAKSSSKVLSDVQEQSQVILSTGESIPLGSTAVGQSVIIKNLGTTGILLEPTEAKSRVKIRIGEKVISVDTNLLEGCPDSQSSAQRHSPPASIPKNRQSFSFPHSQLQNANIVTASLTLDLRGKTVDEAIDMTEAGIDQAMRQGTYVIRVIHGHGTGTLKSALRTYCSSSSYIATFRPGDRSEGGDGVTMVELR